MRFPYMKGTIDYDRKTTAVNGMNAVADCCDLCVYVCECVGVYMRACVCVCLCWHVYRCVCVGVCVCVDVCVCVCVGVCVCACLHLCVSQFLPVLIQDSSLSTARKTALLG